jgi:hypothetical protein
MFMRVGRYIVGLALLGGVACGAADTTVPVSVKFPSMAKNVLTSLSTVVLNVSGSDMTTVSSSQTGPFSSSVSFSVDVPIGNSRAFASTAAVSGSTSTGYQGSTTTNVASSTTSVPLTMLFVNFANNSTAAVGSGPQITAVSTAYSSTEVSLTINFGAAITAQTTALILEFIPASSSTARSQSLINQAKGSVDVTMPSAGTNNIIVNGTGPNTMSPILYTASDSSVSLTNAELSATMNSSTEIEVVMSRTAFINNIDSSIVGTLNILAGTKDSGTTIITPSNITSFTASSVAVTTNGGNVMKYNASFDTSSL